MSTKLTNEIMGRLTGLEKAFLQHITESAGIREALTENKTDLMWIKRGVWGVVGTFVVSAFTVITYTLFHIH